MFEKKIMKTIMLLADKYEGVTEDEKDYITNILKTVKLYGLPKSTKASKYNKK